MELRKPWGYVQTYSKIFGLVMEISWSSTNGFSFIITVTENDKCLKLQEVYLLLEVPIFPLFFLHCTCAGVPASITTPHRARRCWCEGCSSPLAWSSAGGTTMTQMPVWSTVMRRPTSSSWSSMRMCSLNFRMWGRWFNSRYASKGSLWALWGILSSMPQLDPVGTMLCPYNKLCISHGTYKLVTALTEHHLTLGESSLPFLWSVTKAWASIMHDSTVHLSHIPFFSYPVLNPWGSIKTVRQYKYIWAIVFGPKEWNSWGMKCIWVYTQTMSFWDWLNKIKPDYNELKR